MTYKEWIEKRNELEFSIKVAENTILNLTEQIANYWKVINRFEDQITELDTKYEILNKMTLWNNNRSTAVKKGNRT